MTTWPPDTGAPIMSWSTADLRVGDLIFSARPDDTDLLSFAYRVADEQWRHVGALVDHDGAYGVIEAGPGGFGIRSLEAFFGAYDSFGAARLALPTPCIDQATRLMTSKCGDDHLYAWDDLLVAGVLALTRRGIFVDQRDRVRAALQRAAEVANKHVVREGHDSFTCSGFVQWAYDHSGADCSIAHRRWRSQSDWPPVLETLDAFFSDLSGDDRAYQNATVLDLLAMTETPDRMPSPASDLLPINKDQTAAFVRTIAAAVGGYTVGEEPEGGIEIDGRWVTPADLWLSPTVEVRAHLTATM